MSEMTASAVQQQPSDFVDQDFARRLEMAEMILPDCFEALRRYAPSDPIAAEHIAGGIAFFGGVTYPANQIVGMGFEGEVTSQDLDRVENFFRSRGVASTVVVSPLARRISSRIARRSGLSHRGIQFRAHQAHQLPYHSGEPFTLPPGVAIERVTPDTAKPWMPAIAKGFAQDISVAEEVFGGFAALPDALAFLARIEGKVVGGCGGRIIPQARIAAFFGTATLPEFRRRGVQSALIAQRLHEAALAGCEYAVVSTHPGSGSQRNMERRGFRLAYTKVVMMRDWPETTEGPQRWTLKPFGATACRFPMPRKTYSGAPIFASRSTASCSWSRRWNPRRCGFLSNARRDFVEMCERPGVRPAPYMARAQWVALEQLNTLPDSELRELIAESYRLVWERLPKKRQQQLQATASKVTHANTFKKSMKAQPKPKSKSKKRARTAGK